MGVSIEARKATAPSIEISRPFSSLPRPSLEKLNSLREEASSVASELWSMIKHHSIELVAAGATYILTKNELLAFGVLVISESLVNAAEEIIGDTRALPLGR